MISLFFYEPNTTSNIFLAMLQNYIMLQIEEDYNLIFN
jgi:hypothetical protein